MAKYLIIHNKHEGCYDFQCYQDEVARIRLTSITINPPKIFMFTTREEAQDFFEEYINDVDCIDIKCKKGDEVEHLDYCTCGIIELDNERKRYIELGKYCEECNADEPSDDEEEKTETNIVIKEKVDIVTETSPSSQETEKKKKVTENKKKVTEKKKKVTEGKENTTDEKKKRAPRKPKEKTN